MKERIRVLHVDDEPDFLETTAAFLESRDDRFSVDTAKSADEGLHRLSENEGEYDCVVSDYEIPDTDGIELFEKVREEHPDLPFILFTAKGSEQVASDAISAGVTEYLQKRSGPENYDLLANRIETAVAKQRAETNYRELFQKAHIGLTIHDPETGIITDANQAFGDIHGYEAEELVGKHPGDLSPEGSSFNREEANRLITKSAEEGPQTFEWRDQTKDGEEVWVEVSLQRTTINGLPRVLAVVQDITGRKEREEELERQNERLDEFASVVSHDLRNPLTVAKGRLELARTDCESEHLDKVEESLDRMSTLIDDILKLAREGTQVRGMEPVKLKKAVEECWRNVETKDATLVTDTDMTVQADRSRLRQMLENLMRNAVEHSAGGSADGQADGAADGGVTVTADDIDDEDGFYVADDGPGIPEDVREQVFESGYSTSDEGTGFGLSIVREIAEAHGWEIGVTESREGGARFEVTGVEVPD